jgi:ribonuclease HI
MSQIVYESALQKAYNALGDEKQADAAKQEQIPPYITPPWWNAPKTYIERDSEQAILRHQRDQTKSGSIHIYTDGSGIDGHVGAAAVCTTTGDTRSSYLGKETKSTVYVAELQGINLALGIAQETNSHENNWEKIIIYTDNQAAIRSVARPKGKSGAYILSRITQRVEDLYSKGKTIVIKWIPAHKGVLGNEAADKAAKEATGWRENGTRGPRSEEPEELYSLKTTLNTWIHREAHTRWERDWKAEPKGRSTFRYTPRPTAKVLQLHD